MKRSKLKYNLFNHLKFDENGFLKYPSKRTARLAFLEYWGEFLTIKSFASYYGMSEIEARLLIAEGRNAHDAFAEKFKKKTCI